MNTITEEVRISTCLHTQWATADMCDYSQRHPYAQHRLQVLQRPTNSYHANCWWQLLSTENVSKFHNFRYICDHIMLLFYFYETIEKWNNLSVAWNTSLLTQTKVQLSNDLSLNRTILNDPPLNEAIPKRSVAE